MSKGPRRLLTRDERDDDVRNDLRAYRVGRTCRRGWECGAALGFAWSTVSPIAEAASPLPGGPRSDTMSGKNRSTTGAICIDFQELDRATGTPGNGQIRFSAVSNCISARHPVAAR